MNERWAVIWSDPHETDKILSANESQIRSLYDKIKAGQLKLKLPTVEYTTGHSESKQPLDFEHEVTLINTLEPLDEEGFLKEVDTKDPFRPFVAMLEGNFVLPYNISEFYKHRWTYLKNNHLISDESVKKIDDLLGLTDWEIEEYFLKNKGKYQAIDIDLGKEAERRNPKAKEMILNYVIRRKPVHTVIYNDNKYLVFSFEKPIQSFSILIPESARESIPNSTSFYGRLCGIVSYIPNPPPPRNNLVLKSVILAIPIRYKSCE